MGNTYSIPSFSKPCLETKSLAASSCRFNQRFPGKKGEPAENISKGRCPHRPVPPEERTKPSPRGKVARASPASARRMRAKAPLPTEGEPLRLSKNRVIASQCSHWRGNPPDFQTFSSLNHRFLRSTGGFPHQSADWFGMTTYLSDFFDTLKGSPSYGRGAFEAVEKPCHCEPARTLVWQSVLLSYQLF